MVDAPYTLSILSFKKDYISVNHRKEDNSDHFTFPNTFNNQHEAEITFQQGSESAYTICEIHHKARILIINA